jgi:hypothetical protein
MKTTDMILQVPQGMCNHININYLGDNYTVKFTKNTDESITIDLINKPLHFSRELATFKGGKWEYLTEERFHELWNIMKTFPKVHKMFKKMIRLDIYASFNKQFSCGRRRFNIAITRFVHKLKY